MTLTIAAGDEAGITDGNHHTMHILLQAMHPEKVNMHVQLVLLADEVTLNQQCQQLTLSMAGKSHVVNINGNFIGPLFLICAASQSVCNMSWQSPGLVCKLGDALCPLQTFIDTIWYERQATLLQYTSSPHCSNTTCCSAPPLLVDSCCL